MASYETPDRLPNPHNDLVVNVIGAYTELCVNTQRSALLQEGYNVHVHLPGCLEQPSSFNKEI